MTEQEAPSFAIEKIYVKDLSVEVPNAPEIFLERDAPEISLQLQTEAKALGDDAFEVTLKLTVTAKTGEKTAFLVEAGQAGIFRVKNIPEENHAPLFSIACPNILFPYGREVVSDAVTRAGFPPLILQPVNFEAMFAAQLQQESQEGAAATEGKAENKTLQ